MQRTKNPIDPSDRAPLANAYFMGAGYAIRTPKVNYSLEFNWRNNRWNNHGRANEMFLTPGISYENQHDMQMGIAVAVGLNHSSENFQVLSYINFNFGPSIVPNIGE